MLSKVLLAICLIGVISAAAVEKTEEEKHGYGHHAHVPVWELPGWDHEHDGIMDHEAHDGHWAHDWPPHGFHFDEYPEHPGFMAHPAPDHDLHCFSCNENYHACHYPFVHQELEGNYLSCDGQCVKFRNPADNMLWYRGCSNERFSGYQPPVVVKDGIVYYFCDHSGCNIF